MRGLNRVMAIGNLGRDVEARQGPNGAIASFSIAVTETWKDKNTGAKQEKTEWIRCVAFQRLAEVCAEYLRKGSKVYVEGKMTTRKWQNKDGVDQYTTEVVVSDMQMLDSRRESSGESGGYGGGYGGSAPAAAPPQPPATQRRAPAQPAPDAYEQQPSWNDDIPF